MKPMNRNVLVEDFWVVILKMETARPSETLVSGTRLW